MKNITLFLLIVLLAFPTVSIGAEIRTLEIELSFTVPDKLTNQFLGYRLYMGGIQVCETVDQNVSKIACVFSSEEGTFDFTLAAYYSDGT